MCHPDGGRSLEPDRGRVGVDAVVQCGSRARVPFVTVLTTRICVDRFGSGGPSGTDGFSALESAWTGLVRVPLCFRVPSPPHDRKQEQSVGGAVTKWPRLLPFRGHRSPSTPVEGPSTERTRMEFNRS